MLAIRFNYLTIDEPCEAAFKRVLSLSRNYDLYTGRLSFAGYITYFMTHIWSVISIVSEIEI